MEPIVHSVSFDDVARCRPEEILARHQHRSSIVVLSLSMKDGPVQTFLALPPQGFRFGQGVWLGAAYLDWTVVAGFDAPLRSSVVGALKRVRLSLKKVPLTLLNIRGRFDEERGEKSVVWDSTLFQAVTVPVSSADLALQAIVESLPVVCDYMFASEWKTEHRQPSARHGEVLLERAFSIGFAGANFFLGLAYRYDAMAGGSSHGSLLAKPTLSTQIELLDGLWKDLRGVEETLPTGREELLRNALSSQQFYMLDAREFEEELREKVALINERRAFLLEHLACPHFYINLCVSQLDRFRLPKARRREKTDTDWMMWLHGASESSFSSDFREQRHIENYLAAMRGRYPFLAKDPLSGLVGGE